MERDFNPRPRVEGDVSVDYQYDDGNNFNPRPRVEGDLSDLQVSIVCCISILALVWRATFNVV